MPPGSGPSRDRGPGRTTGGSASQGRQGARPAASFRARRVFVHARPVQDPWSAPLPPLFRPRRASRAASSASVPPAPRFPEHLFRPCSTRAALPELPLPFWNGLEGNSTATHDRLRPSASSILVATRLQARRECRGVSRVPSRSGPTRAFQRPRADGLCPAADARARVARPPSCPDHQRLTCPRTSSARPERPRLCLITTVPSVHRPLAPSAQRAFAPPPSPPLRSLSPALVDSPRLPAADVERRGPHPAAFVPFLRARFPPQRLSSPFLRASSAFELPRRPLSFHPALPHHRALYPRSFPPRPSSPFCPSKTALSPLERACSFENVASRRACGGTEEGGGRSGGGEREVRRTTPEEGPRGGGNLAAKTWKARPNLEDRK